MRRILLTAAAAAGVFLAVWCWSFDRYRTAMADALSAQTGGDPVAFAAALDRLSQSYASKVVGELPVLERRLAFAGAARAFSAGKHDEANGLLVKSSAGGEDVLAADALYDLGNLAVAKSNLEGARDQYIKALTLNPGDLQTKINLELLLQRMKDEAEGRKKMKGEQEDTGFLTDYWLRQQQDQEGSGAQSKRIWR